MGGEGKQWLGMGLYRACHNLLHTLQAIKTASGSRNDAARVEMLALFQNEIGYSLGQIATSLVPSPFSNVNQTTLQHCLQHEHYSITLNIGGRRYLRLGDTNDGACVSTHELGRSGGMLPRKIYKIRCSEIASEAIFVLKFIFGLDATRIPGPSVLERRSPC